MGTALVRVTGELLADALHFPPGTKLSGFWNYDPVTDTYALAVRSPDFPAVPPGAAVPDVTPKYRAVPAVPGATVPAFVGWWFGEAGGADTPTVVTDSPHGG